ALNHGEILASAGWSKPALTFGVMNRHFDPMDDDALRFVRPPTAFEIDGDIIADVALGDLVVLTLINMDELGARIVAEGVEVSADKEDGFKVKTVDGVWVTIGRPWLWLTYSLMRATSFVQFAVATAKVPFGAFE